MNPLPRILCVDDEEKILSAIQRGLRKEFTVVAATSGAEGLAALESAGPFQVIVSDMKMPEMNGAEFLKRARKVAPDTVRLLLTGFAELENVVSAINEGHIYRFLAKPCSVGDLRTAILDAVRQHELLTAEKVLLQETLRGSIKALTDILSLASPSAFGRGTRVQQLASGLACQLGHEEDWAVDIAALMSHIGSIILPEDTAERFYLGQKLNAKELEMVERMPAVTLEILGHIPRLEPVLEILAGQDLDFDTDRASGEADDEIPLGARILRVAQRCETLLARGESPARILDTLRTEAGLYDPGVVAAYERMALGGDVQENVRGVTVADLRTGWILTEEVRAKNGVLLVAAGSEVTVSLLERLHNYQNTVGVATPLWVVSEETPGDESAAGTGASTDEAGSDTD